VICTVHGVSAALDIANCQPIRYNRKELLKVKLIKTHLRKNILHDILSGPVILSIENEKVAAQNLI
jgi:hypothetical protein